MPTKRGKATKPATRQSTCGATHPVLPSTQCGPCTREPLHPADYHSDGPDDEGTSWSV